MRIDGEITDQIEKAIKYIINIKSAFNWKWYMFFCDRKVSKNQGIEKVNE